MHSKYKAEFLQVLYVSFDTAVLAEQLHQLFSEVEHPQVVILQVTSVSTKWSKRKWKQCGGYLTLAAKSPLGTGMHYSFDKETLKHFSKSRIWGENNGNLDPKLYYLYPVMNEVLLW